MMKCPVMKCPRPFFYETSPGSFLTLSLLLAPLPDSFLARPLHEGVIAQNWRATITAAANLNSADPNSPPPPGIGASREACKSPRSPLS
uniref:Secreted protein n=1 Tax=Steinernema glaseri TaxID=37863 RepID=A0A1I8ATT8_9BILA